MSRVSFRHPDKHLEQNLIAKKIIIMINKTFPPYGMLSEGIVIDIGVLVDIWEGVGNGSEESGVEGMVGISKESVE